MKIFNRALVAAAMGFVLLVTFGCERYPEYHQAYNDCVYRLTKKRISPPEKYEYCRWFAKQYVGVQNEIHE